MLTYKIKIRRPGQWFYRTFTLSGQNYVQQNDRLICHFANGSCYEVPKFSECEIRFGKDFVEAMKASKAKQETTANGHVQSVQG